MRNSGAGCLRKILLSLLYPHSNAKLAQNQRPACPSEYLGNWTFRGGGDIMVLLGIMFIKIF